MVVAKILKAVSPLRTAVSQVGGGFAAGRYVVLHHFSPDDTEQARERARRAAELLRDRQG
jgi:hypothetical protein